MFKVMTTGTQKHLFPHQMDVPLFGWEVAPIDFAVSSQIPLFDNFPLPIRKLFILASENKHVLAATESAMTHLFAFLLRLAAAIGLAIANTYLSEISVQR